jgi:hypothetical protein
LLSHFIVLTISLAMSDDTTLCEILYDEIGSPEKLANPATFRINNVRRFKKVRPQPPAPHLDYVTNQSAQSPRFGGLITNRLQTLRTEEVGERDHRIFRRTAQESERGQGRPSRQAKITVPFTFAIIGENLSQARGGGFNTKPGGNWTAIKIFLGEGDQEGEVFLNLNPRTKRGQFSMKDPNHGDLVLVERAKVL